MLREKINRNNTSISYMIIITIIIIIIIIIIINNLLIKVVCLFVFASCSFIVAFLSLEYKGSILNAIWVCVPCRIFKLNDELKNTRKKMEDYETR